MGMIASYFRISNGLLNQLKSNPDEIEEIFDESDEIQENELDIDKAWQGIYFLLTGDPNMETLQTKGIGRAVFGGTEIGDDFGYGPLRYLEPDEVKDVSSELEKITADELANRFDLTELNKHGIYPMHKRWSPDDKDYLVDYYDMLRIYFQTAAANNEAMLLLIQ